MFAQLSTHAETARNFIESQLLDMRWLDEYVSNLLWNGGLDPVSPLGATSQLIVCNIVKAAMLLIVLSFVRGMLGWLLAPERFPNSRSGGAAALSGALAGALLPKFAEAGLPSRVAASVRRGAAPEAVAALLFTAPFADPLTALAVLTMAFGIRDALICILSGGVLAVLGGMTAGRIWRQSPGFGGGGENTPDKPSRRSADDAPRLRGVPGQALAEIRYVFPYIVLGSGAAAFIRNWVPESWVQSLIGISDPWAVCLAVVAGIPFGADLFCMLPVVIELQHKGAHPAVLTAFVLSATAFTPAALAAFKRTVKPHVLLLIYALTLIWAAGAGYLLSALPGVFR